LVVAASSSPRRRARFRSNPANFIFTLFDMALMFHWRPVNRLPHRFSRKHAMVDYLSDLAARTVKSFERSIRWAGNLSQRWTGLSLVCSHSGI
jgi:hypothetical protein